MRRLVVDHLRQALSSLWTFWTDYTHQVAYYQSWIWLGLCYYLVIGPTALAVAAARRPLLPSTFDRGGSHWLRRAPAPDDLPSLRRLY
jgi:hypothetical protein